MKKIPVSVIGATGMVGQKYIELLSYHPWFEIVDIGASPNSSGKKYKEAVKRTWSMESEIPNDIKKLVLRDANDLNNIPKNVRCIFSAIELDNKIDTKNLEFEYAAKGYAVISNSSANRMTDDVPMIIPEINYNHADVIPIQQRNHNLPFNGFVAVKPNCSIQSYLTTLTALEEAGYPIEKVQVTTLQALSGGGLSTINSEDMKDNVIPFINGEEEKTEYEPLKILGKLTKTAIQNTNRIEISAACTRVPVTDGHLAVVHVKFKNKKPSPDIIKSIWNNYRSVPQKMNLPMAPEQPIVYFEEENRPQSKLDRGLGKGMSISVGRLVEDKFFDIRYVALSHNLVRGAAGGSILMAELLVEKGFIIGE